MGGVSFYGQRTDTLTSLQVMLLLLDNNHNYVETVMHVTCYYFEQRLGLHPRLRVGLGLGVGSVGDI